MARGDFPSSRQDQFVLRFPDGLRDRIKAAAEKNGRSMNTEIIARLDATLDRDEDGAFKIWLEPDLLDRVLADANESQIDPNLLISGILEKEYPPPTPPGFNSLVAQLKRAIERPDENVKEAVQHFLDAVEGKRPFQSRAPWSKPK